MHQPKTAKCSISTTFLVFISTFFSLAVAEMIAERMLRPTPIPPTQFRVLPANRPEQSYVLPPNASMVILGVPFTTNELGLRDDPVLPKTDGMFRILCLGDSMTFGSGVPAETAYPGVLESRLQARAGQSLKIDVINAGIMGYNMMNILASAETLIKLLQPDAVTYTFVDNDLDDSFSAGPNKVMIEMDPLKPPEASFIHAAFAMLWNQRHPSPKGFFSSFGICRLVSRWTVSFTPQRSPLLNGSGPETLRRWSLWEGRLQALKALCDRHGAKFALYQNGIRNYSEATHRHLQQICKSNTILFASTLPVFDLRTYIRLYTLGYDPHANKAGHMLIAERLDSFLQECGFLPKVCIQPPNEYHKYDETTDAIIEEQLKTEAENMPTVIDLMTGEGIRGVMGGIGNKRRMARSCLFRLGGTGNRMVVEAHTLIATLDQPQTLSARIQDSTPSVSAPVTETWCKTIFDIPPQLEDQVIEVELIANGPIHIPTLAEREGGAVPYTVALRRIERTQASSVP
jgi:hypothetical protein